MVLVKIEPKEAVRFIKLRQSIPHSWDTAGTEEGSDEGGLHVCASFKAYVLSFIGAEQESDVTALFSAHRWENIWEKV